MVEEEGQVAKPVRRRDDPLGSENGSELSQAGIPRRCHCFFGQEEQSVEVGRVGRKGGSKVSRKRVLSNLREDVGRQIGLGEK